jgi:hypothetical protein
MTDTITLTPSALHTILADYNVEPTKVYCAAAGADYGSVECWALPDSQHTDGLGYLIAYGDNGETQYIIDDDVDDLAAWLEYDDLQGVDYYVQRANVRGIDAVDAAESDDEGTYYILETCYNYGPSEVTDVVRYDGRRQDPLEFATLAEAQAWIDDANDTAYTMSHNESGRPSYKIIAA